MPLVSTMNLYLFAIFNTRTRLCKVLALGGFTFSLRRENEIKTNA